MSVVTFWRRVFSSSTTQLSSMPVSSVKAEDRPCMRIMSPLLTVAMVSVCAEADAASARVNAPTRMGVSFIGILAVAETSICSGNVQMFTCYAAESSVPCASWGKAALPSPRRVDGKPGNCRGLLEREQTFGGALVGYQSVHQATVERGANTGHFAFSHGDCHDKRALAGGKGRRGNAIIGEAFDQPAIGIEGPAAYLADGAGLLQGLELGIGDEAIEIERRIGADIADADK